MKLPSGYVNSLLLKMAIDFVSFPMNSMGIFHSYVTVYQRVGDEILPLFFLDYDYDKP